MIHSLHILTTIPQSSTPTLTPTSTVIYFKNTHDKIPMLQLFSLILVGIEAGKFSHLKMVSTFCPVIEDKLS